ncbi:hypothetical protein BU14_0272s0002 [Porphyra umbilicalis]|uniref:Uncharacterized protein n=1 Tax=Porphyra umbilicalis TaxID=2786 RepID=A0A1X6P1E2_PORUM|nr:hypothetical protein BU14_0272s0002 [Porphyra umbilicalis]|eukprot:OSX74684.1 hypothetical protein BU14_0272s0002 [Porphyra umbilicalis]
MHPPPALGPITPDALGRLPELALLRRAPAARRWFAPLDPRLPADRARAWAPADLLGHLTPAALRTAGGGSVSRSGGSSGGGGSGGSASAASVGRDDAALGDWDVGAAADGQEGALGARLVLLSSMTVPLVTAGSIVCGAVINDVLLDRLPRPLGGAAEVGDTLFLSRIGRFAFDTAVGDLVTATPRDDGRAVMYSHTVGCGADMEWTVSVFLRPPSVGGAADGGGGLPLLAARSGSVLRRTEAFPEAAKAAADAAVAAGGAPDPVALYRAVTTVASTFGVAGPPVSDDPADALSIPMTVLTVEPSSRSAVHRLGTLALSSMAVQPARLRVAPPPSAADGDAAARACRRARLLAPAPGAAGGAPSAARLLLPAPAAAPPPGGRAAPLPVLPALGAVAGGWALPPPAAMPWAPPPPPPATAGAPPPLVRQRRRVDLAAITDPVARARVVRNRAAAAASNERRRAARAQADRGGGGWGGSRSARSRRDGGGGGGGAAPDGRAAVRPALACRDRRRVRGCLLPRRPTRLSACVLARGRGRGVGAPVRLDHRGARVAVGGFRPFAAGCRRAFVAGTRRPPGPAVYGDGCVGVGRHPRVVDRVPACSGSRRVWPATPGARTRRGLVNRG